MKKDVRVNLVIDRVLNRKLIEAAKLKECSVSELLRIGGEKEANKIIKDSK